MEVRRDSDSRAHPKKVEHDDNLRVFFPPKRRLGWLGDLPTKNVSLENQLLFISINFTPKTSHSCLKKWYTRFSSLSKFVWDG